MSKQRRRFNAEFKFRVALETAKGQQTMSELAGKHSLGCPQGANQISQWKRQLHVVVAFCPTLYSSFCGLDIGVKYSML